MKLSVVIPTLGRTTEVAALLTSLRALPEDAVEIIIVDQNPAGFLDAVVAGAGLKDLAHHRVDFRGAARARNYGLERATGDVVQFCDDDATADERMYDAVKAAFDQTLELDMVTFKVLDPDTRAPCMMRFADENTVVDRGNFNTITIEFAQFWRTDSLRSLGGYDPSLGVGRYYGADEGMELVVRALGRGMRMRYVNETVLYHPNKADAPLRRYYEYARGTGRVLYLHRFDPVVLKKVSEFAVRSAAGVALFLPWKPRRSMRYAARLGGLTAGFLSSVAGRHVES